MKRNEQIKIDNYKAQYNSILSNINDANRELTKSLSTKTLADKQAKEASVELTKVEERVNKLYRQEREIEVRVNKKRVSVEQREEAVNKAEVLLAEKKLTVEKALTEKKLKLSSENKTIKEDNNNLLIQQKEIKGGIVMLQKEDTELFNEITKREKIRNLLGSETVELEGKKEGLVKQYNKLKETHEKEIDIIKLKIEEEKAKIEIPDKMLKEREAVMNRRENDFLILTLRWKRFFKEHFPNQTLNL